MPGSRAAKTTGGSMATVVITEFIDPESLEALSARHQVVYDPEFSSGRYGVYVEGGDIEKARAILQKKKNLRFAKSISTA